MSTINRTGVPVDPPAGGVSQPTDLIGPQGWRRERIQAVLDELDRYHELHDTLHELVETAEPFMFAEHVVERWGGDRMPVALPAVDAVLIRRALAKVNRVSVERETGGES